jgi:hypothetical protein
MMRYNKNEGLIYPRRGALDSDLFSEQNESREITTKYS